MFRELMQGIVTWIGSKKVKTSLISTFSVLGAGWFGLSAEAITPEVTVIVSAVIGAITTITTLYLKKQGDIDTAIETVKIPVESADLDPSGEVIK